MRSEAATPLPGKMGKARAARASASAKRQGMMVRRFYWPPIFARRRMGRNCGFAQTAGSSGVKPPAVTAPAFELQPAMVAQDLELLPDFRGDVAVSRDGAGSTHLRATER